MNKWVLRIIAYIVILFITIPILTIMASSFTGANYVSFPPQGFSLKWYAEAFQDSYMMRSIGVSFIIALISAIICTLLGLAVTIATERYDFAGKNLVHTIFFAPLTLPLIGLGISLLFFLTTLGMINTLSGLIFAHIVICLPYAIRALSSSVGGLDITVERSAAILGANPFVVFYRIVLPSIMPGLMAAWMFSFLVSFNNVTVSIFIVGSKTMTLPIAIFNYTQRSISPTLAAIASLAITFVCLIVIVLEKRFGVYSMLGKGRQ